MWILLVKAMLTVVRDDSATRHFLGPYFAAEAVEVVSACQLFEGYVFKLLLSDRDIVYKYLSNAIVVSLSRHPELQFLASGITIISILDGLF